MLQRTVTGLVAGFLLVGLGACTGGKDSGNNALKLPMSADPKSLDPVMAADENAVLAATHVFEGLLEYHYLKRPHELQPLLAETLPQVSEDGLTYTFKIRANARFADHPLFPEGKGRAVTAQDFVYSFLRVADPHLGSPGFWIFDGHIKGINEWRDAQKKIGKTNYDAAPDGLKAVDPQTLVISLDHKYPQLLFVLGMAYAAVVPREIVEKLGSEFGQKPCGTGPFILESWVKNTKVVFTKNPTWHGQQYPSDGEATDKGTGVLSDAGKALPFVDSVELDVFSESPTMWFNFLSGNVDVSGIPKDSFTSTIDPQTRDLNSELKKQGVKLVKSSDADVVYTAFNLEDPVIKKGGANLRRAISLAIDKEKTIDVFQNGRGILAHSPIPPGLAGYDAAFVNPYSAFDTTKAKEFLKKAGYGEGKEALTLTIDASNSAESKQLAEKYAAELEAIGVKLKVVYNTFPELMAKINERRAQLWSIAWIADYPDAENFLQLLYGRNKAPGPNSANFDHKEYNKLYEQVRGMSDSPERRKLIRRMQDIFVEELPWMVESHRVLHTLTHRWVLNYKEGYLGGAKSKYLRVNLADRTKGLKKQ